jgi:hypothetical protein
LLPRRTLKILFAGCFLLSLFWLAAYDSLDSRSGPILDKPCKRSGNEFVLEFKRGGSAKRIFSVLNLRPGRIYVTTKPDVRSLEFVTNGNAVVAAEKIGDGLFRKDLRKNLVVRAVRMVPAEGSGFRIRVTITRKPVLSLPLLLFRFAFLFVLLGMGFLTLLGLWEAIIRRRPIREFPVRGLVIQFLALIAIVFAYFVLNIGDFLSLFHPFDPGFVGRTFGFNLGLAVVLMILYAAFSRRRGAEKLPVLLPALVSLPIAILRVPFDIKSSADSMLWVLKLTHQRTDISFAESLSLMLNKLGYHLANSVTRVSAETTLTYTGKAFGILFIFLLYGLVNSFGSFSYKKKLLLFLLSMTFGTVVLLFGFPEFRYYGLPFLMASFLSAAKYVSREDDDGKDLAAAALWAVIAGLFHGMAYFSFPVILLLPLLKYRDPDPLKRKPPFLQHYAAIVLVTGAVFASFFAVIRIFGLHLKFKTAAGGFDGRQFISFLPVDLHFPEAVNFLENGYFASRGWIFFITGSFIFLVFALRMKKPVPWEKSDLVLFLFGLTQFLIVLFWGFDSGIREIDLYIVPTTLIYLFMTRYLLGTRPSDESAWKVILIFSLCSPIYPLLLKTI